MLGCREKWGKEKMSKYLMLCCMYFDGSLIIIIGFQYFKLNRLYEAMLTLDSYFFLGSSSASMLGFIWASIHDYHYLDISKSRFI